MKKLFAVAALFGLCTIALPGCGGHDQKVVEPVSSEDTGLTADEQNAYEESMKSGAYSSGPGSQPPAKK